VLNRSHMHGILHGSTSPQPAVDPGRPDLGVCVQAFSKPRTFSLCPGRRESIEDEPTRCNSPAEYSNQLRSMRVVETRAAHAGELS
jgi:hypothetical protein